MKIWNWNAKRLKKLAIGSLLMGQLFAFSAVTHAEEVVTKHSLVLASKSKVMMHNGEKRQAVQPVVSKKNTSYAPLKSLADIYGYTVKADPAAKEITIRQGDKIIRFKPNTKRILADGHAVASQGILYTEKGSLMIPLRTWASLTGSKLQVSGSKLTLSWSTVEVVDTPDPVYAPPVADFMTDKTEYKMGEHIQYEDRSMDENSEIVRRVWTGKESAFFQPGSYEITLEVYNQHGLSNSVTKTIQVTDETLYTSEEHYMLYSPPGGKIPIQGAQVLDYEEVPYTVTNSPVPLIRSNSPELLLGDEGIAYRDTLSSSFRINIHNKNNSQKELSVYLLATNHGATHVNLSVSAFGKGGPAQYVTSSGKMAVARFLQSQIDGKSVSSMTVPARGTVIVLPEISKQPIKPGLTMTSYAEIDTHDQLEFTVVVLEPGKDPILSLPMLPTLERDGKHVRGTFTDGNLAIVPLTDGLLGERAQRIVLGDNQNDPFVLGIDRMSGLDEVNSGNKGMMYNMEVQVAPRTVIALNARGGPYSGAVRVNDKVVEMTNGSMLKNPDELGVLHRTRDEPETVNLSFIPASGSNMPLSITFMPLPATKQ